MNRWWIKAAAVLMAMFGAAMTALAPKAKVTFPTMASAMALIEAESGKVLYSQAADMPLPMASTTKIMTALVVLENCDMDEEVKIPAEAVGTEGSSIYLKEGESMSVKDLLYGLMLSSGNDAAVALAVHTAGSVEAFVGMMNGRALAMGLEKTRFVTPNGLHSDGHCTTALELCMTAREALANEHFREIVSTKYYRTETGSVPRTFKNKNSLLWNYDGAFGVKTGYTMAAGRCLVFGAERDGMTVIGAVLNCRPMFETAAKLMDLAFENYVKETVVREGDPIGTAIIENGEDALLEVAAKDSIIDVLENAEKRTYTIETELYEGLRAPIRAGDEIGSLTVKCGEETVGATKLVAVNSIAERGFDHWWRLLISAFAA
ncbi:MAG: D-alanyl-D-alanine carboxypeptidase [Clostridiales bacterium]|nr:D-alanyl-D-alanine carboxypeptidase [Clostridiales bacterium]